MAVCATQRAVCRFGLMFVYYPYYCLIIIDSFDTNALHCLYNTEHRAAVPWLDQFIKTEIPQV